jgi:hypothetical protein
MPYSAVNIVDLSTGKRGSFKVEMLIIILLNSGLFGYFYQPLERREI